MYPNITFILLFLPLFTLWFFFKWKNNTFQVSPEISVFQEFCKINKIPESRYSRTVGHHVFRVKSTSKKIRLFSHVAAMEFEPVGRYIRSQSVIRAKRPPSTVRFFQVSLNVASDKQFLFIFKSILKTGNSFRETLLSNSF